MHARKMLTALALATLLGGVIASGAEARAGRSFHFGGSSYRSMGDRGSRTFNNNGFQGITQSRRPAYAPQPGGFSGQVGGVRSSWGQRHPILGGMLGGFAGSALFNGLFGQRGGYGGYGDGGYGGGGGFGGLLNLLILGGIAYFGYRWWKRRGPQAFATQGMGMMRSDEDAFGAPATYSSMLEAPNTQTKEQGLAAIALHDASFTTPKAEDQLSSVFFRVQEAWSNMDRATLREICTPEMVDYFLEDLEGLAQRGERNVLKNIVIKVFDVSEAWTEAEREFITARIQARLLDYVERDGQVIEGSASEPTDFAEVWTFARPRGGGTWQLSAINQA